MKGIKITGLVLVLAVLVFVTCKKKDAPAPATPPQSPPAASTPNSTVTPADTTPKIYDTIKPKSYYPAYPGSWWQGVYNNGSVATTSVEPSYMLHSYTYRASGGQCSSSVKVYAPVVEGRAVYGYNIYNHKDCHSLFPYPFDWIFKENPKVGDEWQQINSTLSSQLSRITNDTVMTVQGKTYSDVYEVSKYTLPSGGGPFKEAIYYIARDVGYIKKVSVYANFGNKPDSVLSWWELQNYHIAKP